MGSRSIALFLTCMVALGIAVITVANIGQ